jgi:branched-subunit amino acid transport protein
MNGDLLVLALLAGAANWAFRFLPTKLSLKGMPETGPLARFLAATGPAAIGTLFVAALLPSLSRLPEGFAPLFGGIATVLAVFWLSRSVIAATLCGSVAFGICSWVLG